MAKPHPGAAVICASSTIAVLLRLASGDERTAFYRCLEHSANGIERLAEILLEKEADV